MNNGKRPECWRCPGCAAMWLENADEEIGVTLAMECGPCGEEMERAGPVLLASDLESLAQELEEQAEAVEAVFDAEKTRGTVSGFMRRVEFETLRSAAQLVRAKIEEGGRG